MSLPLRSPTPSYSVIALDKFILATRDSGYRGTDSAISELVDNSLQASARNVQITIAASGTEPNREIEIRVLDDGCGMESNTLRQALRFGGSSRFNDRRGMGRYGMGLPNSSFSQARRVTVFTWQVPTHVYSTHLDVDEIASGELEEVPTPRRVTFPDGVPPSPSGTMIVWTRCDRLDNRRVSTNARKLAASLGQTFRTYLWDGVTISINGQPIEPSDPLFLRTGHEGVFAQLFGEPIDYEIQASLDEPERTGRVRITFTELPVRAWHGLSNEKKRELGIAKGAGVSVVRGGREVDYGWFFMGAKRRENYDDWFRCQIEFDPILDEAFGITHTKQQVRPQQYLLDILTPDIEATAHALNGRVRKAHLAIKTEDRFADAERVADERDRLLAPLPAQNRTIGDDELARQLKRKHPSLRSDDAKKQKKATPTYRIVEDDLDEMLFFRPACVDGQVVAVLNRSHAFYKRIYKPLLESEQPRDVQLRAQIELVLLAATRAEISMSGKASEAVLAKFRSQWSEALAAFLNG